MSSSTDPLCDRPFYPHSPTTNPVAILTQNDSTPMPSFPSYVKVHGHGMSKPRMAPATVAPAPTDSKNFASTEDCNTDTSTAAAAVTADTSTAAAAVTADTSTAAPIDTDTAAPPIDTDAADAAATMTTATSPSSTVEPATGPKPKCSATESSKGAVSIPLEVQKILTNARKTKNFSEEIFPDDLPTGWILHLHRRPGLNGKEHVDRYWFTPKTGKRLRSRTELKKYLAYLETSNGDEAVAWAKVKGKTTKISQKVNNSAKTAQKSRPRNETGKRKAKSVGAVDGQETKKKKKRVASSSPRRQKAQGKKSSPEKTKIAKSTMLSPDESGSTARAKQKQIAESKAVPGRRKKLSSKKASSSDPFKVTNGRNPNIPDVAESK